MILKVNFNKYLMQIAKFYLFTKVTLKKIYVALKNICIINKTIFADFIAIVLTIFYATSSV